MLLNNEGKRRHKSNKDNWNKGKTVGLLVISLGILAMIVVLILVIIKNRHLFYKHIGNTSVTINVTSEVINTDLENIPVIERSDPDDTSIDNDSN